jgi:hypothetical protein
VAVEVIGARDRYPPFISAHEGYAVILEKVRELEMEVFKNPTSRTPRRMYAEAQQVAARAVRFMLDIGK